MRNFIAVLSICAVLLSIVGCGRHAPVLKQKRAATMEGILVDHNENVAVLRGEDGNEHLFWLNGDISCEAENGQRVLVTYEVDSEKDSKVLNLVSVAVL